MSSFTRLALSTPLSSSTTLSFASLPARLSGLLLCLALCGFAPWASAQVDGLKPRFFTPVPGSEPAVSLFTVDVGDLPSRQVWRTDGTASGTRALPLCPPCNDQGCSSCGYRSFTAGEDGVFLGVGSAEGGAFAWTDGSADTIVHMPPVPRLSGSETTFYSPTLGGLLFVASTLNPRPQLWFWDGTPLPPVKLMEGPQTIDGFAEGAGKVFVKASVGFKQYEIWSTDGTAAGTTLLGPVPGQVEWSSQVAALGDRAVMLAGRLPCQLQVWAADATGVRRATTLDTDFCLLNRSVLTTYGDTAFFIAESDAHGYELWSTDGTAAGTRRLTDFPDPYPFELFNSDEWANLDGEVYFSALAADGEPDLWRSDGTPGGTVKVLDLCGGECEAVEIRNFGDAVTWIEEEPGPRSSLWVSDGTATGSRVLASHAWDRNGFRHLTRAGNHWYTFAEQPSTVQQLYALRPGEGEFDAVTDFSAPYALFTASGNYGTLGSRLLFTAAEAPLGPEPWISDGTPAGTTLLTDAADRPDLPPPQPPVLLAAEPLADGSVRIELERGDSLAAAGEFYIQARSPGQDWTPVAATSHLATSVEVPFLQPDTPYTFRAQASNPTGISGVSNQLSARTRSEAPAPTCEADDSRLCLGEGRFGVEVVFWNQHAEFTHVGDGQRVEGDGDRTGYFWFFKPDNVELVVKVLDGGRLNGHAWLFYGALSNVEYWVTLTDHTTGRSRTYHNPPGEICGLADTTAFSVAAASTAGGGGPLRAFDLPPRSRVIGEAEHAGPCVEDGKTLCLQNGRYAVTVDWHDQHNDRSGVGGAVPFADRTGFFWFFSEDNIELVVKILDGTSSNGKTWVFYGALTDVGYTLTVTDTATGDSETYVNEPGNVCGGADTTAF